MIRDMLKKENVQIVQSVQDWREAVQTSVLPLVKGQYVEPRYIDGIIENTNLYGPYYVLAPDLALLHARSDQGVIEKQLAVTVLKEPVKFSEDGYDVRLLVVLAAADGESHMEAISSLATIFANPQRITEICECKHAHDIYQMFLDADQAASDLY